MKFNKIAILTVAAVVSTFASTLQAQRPVFASNGNANWSSTSINSSFYPDNSNNPFRRTIISGDSIKSFNSGSTFIRFRPRVYIIQFGDTIKITGKNNIGNLTGGSSITAGGIDTLYIYGVLDMGSGTNNDLEMFYYVSGSTNSSSRSGLDYNGTTFARKGVINLMGNGKIIGGTSSTNFQWGPTTNNIFGASDINGPYGLSGARQAVSVTTSNTSASSRFQIFVPNFLPLPVDIASFHVNSNEIGHEVSWTAIGESNRNNFILEISTNGRDFTQVAEISGNPEANKQIYNYVLNRQDRAFFVRLSETNTTGYTHVLATKYVSLNNAAIASCNVYPTVVAAAEELNLMFSEINSYQVQVINYNGVSFINSTIETATENEVSRLELSQLPAGQYLVKVYSPSGFSKTEKIIITE